MLLARLVCVYVIPTMLGNMPPERQPRRNSSQPSSQLGLRVILDSGYQLRIMHCENYKGILQLTYGRHLMSQSARRRAGAAAPRGHAGCIFSDLCPPLVSVTLGLGSANYMSQSPLLAGWVMIRRQR